MVVPVSAEALSALEAAVQWYKDQEECTSNNLVLLRQFRDLAADKKAAYAKQNKVRKFFKFFKRHLSQHDRLCLVTKINGDRRNSEKPDKNYRPTGSYHVFSHANIVYA